jgi:hypothetical protein
MKFITKSRSPVTVMLVAILALTACDLAAASAVVNEVELSPSNEEAPMWVELYNSGDAVVDVTGWTITIKDQSWAGKMHLQGILEPKGFMVAEGQTSWIKSSNGTVILTDGSGNTVDSTPLLQDTKANDFSWGRIPDGKDTDTKGDFVYTMGTKGRPNGGSIKIG